MFGDDKDDDIPLANPRADAGLCWSCQSPIPSSGQPVSLTPDILPPVCMDCWQQMSVSERLQAAIAFKDRASDKGPLRFHGSN